MQGSHASNTSTFHGIFKDRFPNLLEPHNPQEMAEADDGNEKTEERIF